VLAQLIELGTIVSIAFSDDPGRFDFGGDLSECWYSNSNLDIGFSRGVTIGRPLNEL